MAENPSGDLSVLTETLPGSQVGLTIEVPREQVDAAFDRVLSRLAQRVKIEGFRPGRAPRGLVEARVGPAALREETIDSLVPALVGQAIRDQSIEAIDRPQVDIVQFERGRPARLTARVSIMPEVTLPDLSSLRVERPRTEVTDEMLESRLRELRETVAEITPVEREVRPGDLIVADLDVEVEGQAVESEARRATELEVGEGTIIPELFGVLPGKNVGEVAEADVTLPAEHPDPSLAGHAAHLRMTVRGVKEKLVPDLDDDLAGRLSGGRQGTAAEFREAVRGELEVAAERVDELAYEQQVLKRLVEASAVEIPQSLVDREVARHVEDLQTRLSRQGLRLDRYLDYLGTTGEEWLAQAGPDAEGRLKVDMVLEEVSRRESVEPAEEELVAYTREETARDPEPEGKVDEILASPAARDYFTHRLRRLQTLRRLVELAAGNAHPKEAPAGPAPVAPATSSSAHRT